MLDGRLHIAKFILK